MTSSSKPPNSSVPDDSPPFASSCPATFGALATGTEPDCEGARDGPCDFAATEGARDDFAETDGACDPDLDSTIGDGARIFDEPAGKARIAPAGAFFFDAALRRRSRYAG